MGVTAWETPPNWSLVRVLTSTNTTVRAASSAAITSSSPYRQRQLRVSTRRPSDVRWSTASCSPSAPISARVNVVMPPPSEPEPTTRRRERAVIPRHVSIHNRRAPGFAAVKKRVYGAMVEKQLQGVAGRATDSDAFEYAARAGFAVSGALHLLIAYIILRIAFGAGGNADQSGALATLGGQTGGTLILWVVAVGLVALGLWRIAEAIVGSKPGERSGRGNDDTPAWKRAKSLRPRDREPCDRVLRRTLRDGKRSTK